MIGLYLFILGYFLNMFYISVLYHRGLAHGSVTLSPMLSKLLEKTGVWMTGIDPLSWALMHRLHHQYSDQKNDPHSPNNGGIFSVWKSQYTSYLYYMERMQKRDDEKLNRIVDDIHFGVSKVNSNLPYVLHLGIALLFSFIFQTWIAGVGYFIGIMGHPIQGWMINALAHRFGSISYDNKDSSKNNLILGYLVFGEGYQNNHHAFPKSANFAMKFPEFDPGYLVCRFCRLIRVLK